MNPDARIENEQQLHITISRLRSFKVAIKNFQRQEGEHPLIAKARLESMQSVATDLQRQVDEWKRDHE